MNENINLCEILKGHEGETFYSPTFGELILQDTTRTLLFEREDGVEIILLRNGKWSRDSEDISVFPSKDQRDWNKWIEEQNDKIPKTWSELVDRRGYTGMCAQVDYTTEETKTMSGCGGSPVEKSARALLKIYQLIEVGYGGNVTYERCSELQYDNVYKIAPIGLRNYIKFDIEEVEEEMNMNHIMFHTRKQAEEFLSYPENVQLLKDYFMI